MNYRKKANITLACVAVGFVASSILLFYNKENMLVKMVFYVVEAALIGGMADWFAVTAIFKKPLGFPFHTAIIPRNRATIVNSVANIVEKEFLSEDLIAEKLERVEITPKIIQWIDSENGREYGKKAMIGFLKRLDNKDFEKASAFLGDQIAKNTQNLDLNKHIHSFLSDSAKSGSYKKLIAVLLDDIIKVAEGPGVKEKILQTIEGIKAEKTKGFFGALFDVALEESNLVNIREIADSIHMHLIETLYDLKQEDSEDAKLLLEAIEEQLLTGNALHVGPEVTDLLREQLVGSGGIGDSNSNSDGVINAALVKAMAEALIVELEHEEKLIEGTSMAAEALDRGDEMFEETSVDAGCEAAETEAAIAVGLGTVPRRSQSLAAVVMDQLVKTWNNMKNDKALVSYIEQNLKESINILIQREHSVIGKIVRETLNAFSDDALNKFIEDRAGNDLQWIRINGSIVGGMVGLLVFLFQTFFYEPVAVPFIRGLFM